MRYHCYLKPIRKPSMTPVWLALLAGVSLLAISVATPVRAQGGEFAVDVSDPSVSIDLSVLNDGGLAPQMGTMAPGMVPGVIPYSAAPAYGSAQAPGPNAPVSTLYIQPSAGFTLPPQTKAIIAQPAPEPAMEPASEMDVAEDTPIPAAPEEAAVAEEILTEAVPPAPMIEPATSATEMVEQTAEQAPEPVAEPVKEVAVAEPVQAPVEAPAATPTPDIAPVAAVSQEPVSEPMEQAAAPEAAPQTAPMAPPPAPQALTQSAADAQMPQAIQQAPATAGSVVVQLPPKLEELQPGVASLPPSTGPLTDGDNMRIVFEHDSSKLPTDAREALKTLSSRMSQQDGLRLQLLAYAGGTDTSASAARRLSLSRALAVRSYLIENGVRSTRIDVRALGNKSTESVTERVDITIVER